MSWSVCVHACVCVHVCVCVCGGGGGILDEELIINLSFFQIMRII